MKKNGGVTLAAIMTICMLIIFIVIILSIITITKAYKFKHTIDSLPPENPEQE
ncbi:MAG: YtzI protein [Bacillus sp. (in: firmicutes)]